MERYFAATKSRTNGDASKQSRSETKASSSSRYQPYKKGRSESEKKSRKSLLELLPDSETTPSRSTLNKLLLSTLDHEANPITHSDIAERSDHVVSTASGHQVSESGNRHQRLYFEHRREKLARQQERPSEEVPQVMHNVRVYIDGFLSNTTDLEMKRIVSQAGGQVLLSASGATHILTSQPLNGSKTHKLLTKKSRSPIHVVKPEWVFDSIEAGKRRPEREYTILKDGTSKNLHDMWQK
ncbi:hypothetical protein VKT23_001906 [Stygiomarasmius scandens]|uniref:BRCT domain-containing protein n=1 Tax=Marasmiellus scandens TaxID=2682957 RepID=A0ABR1K406_9AGAR